MSNIIKYFNMAAKRTTGLLYIAALRGQSRRPFTRVIQTSLVNRTKAGPPIGGATCLMAGILGFLGLEDKSEPVEETDEEKLINSIKLGVYALQQGDLDKSEYLLHISLRMAQDLQHENGVFYIYTLLADIAFQRGDFGKSERLYIEIMKREVGRGVPQNANSLVEISLKLAQIFSHRNEIEKAEQGFKFCIDTQEKKMKEKQMNEGEDLEDILGLWGMSRDWYGNFLLARHRYPEALSQFQEAYSTCCEVYGDSHPQACVLLNSLGTVSSLMGKDEQAINYYNKAVILGREIESEDLPTFLVNLGMAQIKSGLKREAQAACQEAKALAKKSDSQEEVSEAEHCLELLKSATDKKT